MNDPIEMGGADFRDRRIRLQLTQAQMAALLGCTRQHIWNLEDRVAVPAVYALALMQIEAARENAAA